MSESAESLRIQLDSANARLRAIGQLPAQWETRAAIGEAHDQRAVQFRTAATELRAALGPN